MEDTNRNADVLNAAWTISTLQSQLNAAKEIVARCLIQFDVEVTDDFQVKVFIKKADGSGLIQTLSVSDVDYFSADAQTITSEIVVTTFENLMKQQMTDELLPKLSRAIANSVKARSKI